MYQGVEDVCHAVPGKTERGDKICSQQPVVNL